MNKNYVPFVDVTEAVDQYETRAKNPRGVSVAPHLVHLPEGL